MMKETMRLAWGLVLMSLLVLGACSDKRVKEDKTDSQETKEEMVQADRNDSVAVSNLPVAEKEKADKEDMNGENEDMSQKASDAYENEVWPHLGGTYSFGDANGGMVVLDVGINEDEGTNFLCVGEGKYSATIDPETALITAFDENGKKVFEGYVTKGGNMLKGTLFGKKVKFEGLCGL